jgi:hypothetical protein
MFYEYDVVSLKQDIPSNNLRAGAEGTVLIVYNEPSLPLAYEVEFLGAEGETLAIVTLTADADVLELV